METAVHIADESMRANGTTDIVEMTMTGMGVSVAYAMCI